MKNKKEEKRYSIFTEKSYNMAKKKVLLLGINYKYTANYLLTVRLVLAVLLFLFVILYFPHGYFLAPLLAFLSYISFFPLVIDSKIKKRTILLEKDAAYFFEILALSLETGKNIKNAIEITINSIDSELSNEFKKTMKDVRYGKDLDTALKELSLRIPSDAINNIILNIRQSNIFGNNIINTVYDEIDYIREKRLLDIKGEISKIPVKISVISVIFFIPLLLLLLLGPLLINLL